MQILFIGAINLDQKPSGGEEFKNQLLLPILANEFSLKVIDTTNWKRKPWIFFSLISSILDNRFDKIVISTSTVSAYRLFSFLKLFYVSKLNKTKYFVIGGYLPDGLEFGKLKPKIYQKLGGVVVEGNFLKNKLLKFDISSNVISNFKNAPPKRIEFKHLILRNENTNCFRFVFLSRMIEKKGIFIIIEAVNKLNKFHGTEKVLVDFYGPINDENLSKFKSLAPENCVYKGYLDLSVNNSENYKILSSYHAMLFPTKWYGEGFPGILIDAFICGLPVICSDINMNKEVILDSFNGIILEQVDSENLSKSMHRLFGNINLLNELSKNSYNSFDNFSVEHCKNAIIGEIYQ